MFRQVIVELMSTKWVNVHTVKVTLIIFLILGLASLVYVNLHFLDPLGHSLKDYEVTDIVYSQLRDPSVDLDERIVLVNIGQPDREVIGRMIHRIADAKPRVIGLDIFFSGVKDPDKDAVLQQAVRRTDGKLVLATALSDYDEEAKIFRNVSVDDTLFSNYGNIGFANFPANPTRTIRYFSPREFGPNGKVDAFSVEMARLYDPQKVQILFDRKKTLERIHYTATEDFFIKFEPETILDSTVDLSLLRDKIVLLGYSGSLEWNDPILDRYYTPLNESYSGKSHPDMQGFVIHANIIRMILDEAYTREVPMWLSLLLAFILCYFNIRFLIWLHHHHVAFYHLTGRIFQIMQFAIIFFVIATIYHFYQIKLDFTWGLLALVIAVDTYVIYHYLLEARIGQFWTTLREKIRHHPASNR
jgi:CHASE2 domain-containing sensor protein